MFNRSQAWAAGLLAAVFVAGGAIGWVAGQWSHGGRHRHPRGSEAMIAYLERELALTDPQRDSVRAVFQRRRVAVSTLWKEVRPRLDSLRSAMQTEIAAQLDEGQRTRYLQLLAEKEHRDRKRHGRADTGRRE